MICNLWDPMSLRHPVYPEVYMQVWHMCDSLEEWFDHSVCCSVLQRVAVCCSVLQWSRYAYLSDRKLFHNSLCGACNTLLHCNTLQHTATHCNTLSHCNTLQHNSLCGPCILYMYACAYNQINDSYILIFLYAAYIFLCCSVVQRVWVRYRVLPCVTVCYREVQCGAVCCSMMQVCCGVAHVWRSHSSLEEWFDHSVCCSVLQRVAVCCSVLLCVAVCCSVLQCVAVCCTLLQCVAVCCSVLRRHVYGRATPL